MRPGKLVAVVLKNVRRNRKNLVFSSIGIVVGVSVFSFFTALTIGVREEVLNRMYPVDLIEVEPSAVSIAGTKSRVERLRFEQDHLEDFTGIPGIGEVFPKLKSRFQAVYRIGGQLFGERGMTFEAYFDGLDDALLRADLAEAQAGTREERRRQTLRERYGRERRCYEDEDCSPGEECGDGKCRALAYWRLFRDHGEFIPCRDDAVCAEGYACVLGQCRTTCDDDRSCGDGRECRRIACAGDADCGGATCEEGRCAASVCLIPCKGAPDCPAWQECVPEKCGEDDDCVSGRCVEGRCAAAGSCDYIRCRQERQEADLLANPELRRGVLPELCEDGSPVEEGELCPPARCPARTFCSVYEYRFPNRYWRDRRGEGRCEHPIPVVINPIVLEIFNLVMKSTFGRAELGTMNAFMGYDGEVLFGHSFYKDPVKDRIPVQKRMLMVGFSRKALEHGVTMPMEYVRRANSRFKGRESTRAYDSIILQLAEREKLPEALDYIEEHNVQLSRRSAEAEKFRTILVVALAIFFIMASVILSIAAINITHVFLMVIYERKREIGILRSVGATRMDVRLLFLGESLFIGVLGGVAGNLIAWSVSRGVDLLVARYVGDFPLKPETFFHFEPLWVGLSVAVALFFSLLGAFFPANRAAGLDPARVLTAP